jgi:transcriptional regulator with XRE-family HTH domain
MARDLSQSFGREVLLARTNLALTRRAASRLANVSPTTQRRVEDGDPSVEVATVCRVASAVGLRVWGKAFPAGTPSLRDTGQLRFAEQIRSMAYAAYRIVIELALGNGRAIDMALLGSVEIMAIEIERLIADFQAQHRAASAKRDELAAAHQRPVRLVIALEDTRRNRAAMREHDALIRSALPADSREVLRAIRTGAPLGRDGLLWIRPRAA